MGSIKDLDSTAVYAYTTLVSVIICVPLALIFEGGAIKQGIQTAAESHPNFWYQLTIVGLLYHLYNQVQPELAPPVGWHFFDITISLGHSDATCTKQQCQKQEVLPWTCSNILPR